MVLKKVYRQSTRKYEWALVSRKTGKVLQYFGTKKPSKKEYLKAERRVQFFKHKKKHKRRAHRRRTKKGYTRVREHVVKGKGKRPKKIGSKWRTSKGKYIHGPRLVDPNKCQRFRLGKPTKSGKRVVYCQLKSGKWVKQSTLRPR